MRKTAAAKKGKPPAASATSATRGGDGKTRTTTKSSSLPLESVHCCVETFNSDGVDSSNGFILILKELGAQIETGGIRAGLTHMVWSNGNMKHLRAAEFMDIVVVSPLWVEQCRESNSKAPEKDFLVTAENATFSTNRSTVSEPVPDAANSLPEPDSPSLDSSKRGPKSKAKATQEGKQKVTPPKKGKRGEVIEATIPPVTVSLTKSSSKNSRKSAAVASDSEGEDDEEGEEEEDPPPPAKGTKKKATGAAKKIAIEEPLVKKPAQKKKSSSSISALQDPNCRMIALSGFEGEDRAFMADLLQSIITSVPPDSSSSTPTSFGLFEDNDFSLAALTKSSYIVASTNPMRRSLRILFGMILGTPIVTAAWIHSCLEHNDWVDTSPFLHPRFDRSKSVMKLKNKKPTAKVLMFVAVGSSSNPSKEIINGLVENWSLTQLVSSASEADYVIVDNSELTRYEMRATLSKLFPKNSADAKHVLNLLEEGKILTTKALFDCIEDGTVRPHHFPSSSDPPAKKSRKGVPKRGPRPVVSSLDEEEVEEMERLYVAPPVRYAAEASPVQKLGRGAQLAAKRDDEDEGSEKNSSRSTGRRVVNQKARTSDEEDEEEYKAPVKVLATKRSGERGVPSPARSERSDLTPMRGSSSSGGNRSRKRGVSSDEEEEDVSPTPVKIPATKRSRSSPSPSSPSPVRLRLPLQDSEDEWNEDRGPSAADEASPSW